MSKVIEKIYENDWYIFDGPEDINVFREAINHPQFKRIEVDHNEDCGLYHAEIIIKVYTERDETEEEVRRRVAKSRAASRAASKAAKTREENKLKKEREEYERLKKKFKQ